MNRPQIIKWVFRTLCIVGLAFILCRETLVGQDKPKQKVEALKPKTKRDTAEKKSTSIFSKIKTLASKKSK